MWFAKPLFILDQASSRLTSGVQENLGNILAQKISEDPFRIVTFLIFMGAICHTFLAGKFSAWSHQIEMQKGEATCLSKLLHLLGEVEAIFGLWLVPLIISFCFSKGWDATVQYFSTRHYTEPIFVFAIMTIAATKPILYLAENCIRALVRCLGGERPSIWWLCILVVGPLLGSLITEPAAMTIAAMLLGQKVFAYQPGKWFSYATLGLLFVNVSVGGVLTNFAAPPVLMVASCWNWNTAFVFSHFGIKAIVGIFFATLFYFVIFYKQLSQLNQKAKFSKNTIAALEKIPFWVTCIHVGFLVWIVFNSHNATLIVWGFLAFLAASKIMSNWQSKIALRESLLVGCFLAGLVTHGGLQEWWIQALLSRLSEQLLFFGSVLLTAFNDNASITYLASLVPEFAQNFNLQAAVVGGAVVGGGLTVIANAPNPAGQSLLSKFFENGSVKPLPLFLGALSPTLFMVLAFRWLVL